MLVNELKHGKNQGTVKACWPAAIVWQVKMSERETIFQTIPLPADRPAIISKVYLKCDGFLVGHFANALVQLFSSSQMQPLWYDDNSIINVYIFISNQANRKHFFRSTNGAVGHCLHPANNFNNNDNQPQKEELFFIVQCVTLFEITTGGATNTDPLASERPHQSPQSLFWKQARLSHSFSFSVICGSPLHWVQEGTLGSHFLVSLPCKLIPWLWMKWWSCRVLR